VSGGGKTPTFCVFPVFSVAELWKSVVTLDGDGNTISGQVVRGASRVYFFRFVRCQYHRLPLTGIVDGTYGG
jgi:hypothetical protein